MAIERRLLDLLNRLTAERQQEVLDFAEFLALRGRPAERWPAGYFSQVAGRWEGPPLERAPEGAFETRPELSTTAQQALEVVNAAFSTAKKMSYEEAVT